MKNYNKFFKSQQNRILLIVTMICFAFLPQKSYADSFLGQYLDWFLYTDDKIPSETCYMVATPLKKLGNVNGRGEPYFLITKSAENLPEVSVSSGYYYKNDTEVELSFGLKKFNMIAYKSKAWSYDVSSDIEIVKAMRTSDTVIVYGIASKDKYSSDTYSLIGFDDAYQRMLELCQ